MRLWPLFPALHLYPSDTKQTHARRAGMQGLRHKPRHKVGANSGTSEECEAYGNVHLFAGFVSESIEAKGPFCGTASLF